MLNLVMLRALGLLFDKLGEHKTAEYFETAADFAEEGGRIDDHMALVLEKLKAREEPDFTELRERIIRDSAKFQGGEPEVSAGGAAAGTPDDDTAGGPDSA